MKWSITKALFKFCTTSHLYNLKTLFSAAKSENVTFNNIKCVFACTKIDLLGYRISHDIIQSDPERLRPLLELPLPQKKS